MTTATTAEPARDSATGVTLLRDYVNGRFVDSRATARGSVFNPATGAVIAEVP